MIKELLLLASVVSPYIQEPNRATYVDAYSYEIVNACENRIVLFQAYSDEDVIVSGSSKIFYPYKVRTDDDFVVSVYQTDYVTAPTDLYYIYKASDFEDPVTITGWTSYYGMWVTTIEAYEPSTGLQVGRYESLNGVHGFIYEERLGINGNLNTALPFNTLTNLIPSGVTFSYVLNTGVTNPVQNALYAQKVKASVGSVNNVALYANINRTSIIAFNGYDPNLNPFLLYYGNFTNEVVFRSGYKTVKYGEMHGSLPYFFTDSRTGYMAYNNESINDGWDALTKSFELVGMVFDAIGTPLSWMILPGISIGILLVVPLLIGMFVWLIKFLKKG